MCVKLSSGDLNLGPYPPHPISIYTYAVTIAQRVCGGLLLVILLTTIGSVAYVANRIMIW